MQEVDPIENWLKNIKLDLSEQKQLKEIYRDCIQKFAQYSKRSPQQIIDEYSKASEKQFKKTYTQLLLDYTSQLQKQYSPNTVREQTNIIQSFFGYYKLPIGFGVKAHIQFFFK